MTTATCPLRIYHRIMSSRLSRNTLCEVWIAEIDREYVDSDKYRELHGLHANTLVKFWSSRLPRLRNTLCAQYPEFVEDLEGMVDLESMPANLITYEEFEKIITSSSSPK